ncbi:MAG TPA: DnaB-like helicase C-terminal domain-containing protein, partial [bacterium]|nr:DnaB-like helicase C-terminal domain-containing protein [bacterium]
GRGYHVQIHNYFGEGIEDRVILKATIGKYFPQCDLAIYGATSLIRAPYSINYKSGLYKVPFSFEEFMGYKFADIEKISHNNTIRNVAKIIRQENTDWSNYIERDIALKIENNNKVEGNEYQSNTALCIQAILQEGDTGFDRHHKMLRVGGHFYNAGLPIEYMKSIFLNWNKTLESKEIVRTVESSYKHGYKFSCSDAILTRYCDSRCKFYTKKNYGNKIVVAENYEKVLTDYAEKRNNDKYRLNLQHYLNLPYEYCIYSGEMVVVIGDTGMGKSAFVQNIVATSSYLKWLVFPLENGYLADLRRYVQITNDMSKNDVIDHYTDGGSGLTDKIQHIQFVQSSVDTNNLRQIIAQSTADIFVIDTLPAVTVVRNKDRNDTNETKEEIIAKLIRQITVDFNKTIIVVHHVSKNAVTDDKGKKKELTVHSTKGNSAIEQLADKVISIEGDRNDGVRIIKSQKARDEAPFIAYQWFDKDKFKFRKHIGS